MEITTVDNMSKIGDDGKIIIAVQTNLNNATAEEQADSLSPEDREKLDQFLKTFITDIDSPVYAFKNLTPEFIAGLFAKYSRSPKNMIDVFIDHCALMEFTDDEITQMSEASKLFDRFNTCKATKDLHEKFTNGGHESIKKMASAIPVAIDACSVLTASEICSGRIGLQITERSTRYQKDFFRPDYVTNFLDNSDTVTRTRFGAYMSVCFKVAKAVYDDVLSVLESLYPYNESNEMIMRLQISKATWNKWIKNRAMDNARYCFPVAMTTGLGVVANIPGYDRMVSKLVNSSLPERQLLGGLIAKAVNDICPTIRVATEYNYNDEKYNSFTDQDIDSMRNMILQSVAEESEVLLGPPTSDVDLCRLAMDRKHMNESDLFTLLASVMIARQISLPPDVVYLWMNSPWFKNLYADLNNPAPGFSDSINHSIYSHVDFALRILGKFTGEFQGGQIANYRRDVIGRAGFTEANVGEVRYTEKLPRIFEMVDVTFDMVQDFGTWRDLNRHAFVSSINWALVPNLGYSVPDDYNYLTDATKELYQTLFTMSVDMWETIKGKYGTDVAQYAGLMMWNQRRWLKMNLRELDYIVNLRTRYTGHHGYRRAAQLMCKRALQLWPTMNHLFRPNNVDYMFGLVRRGPDDPTNSNAGIPTIKKDYVPVADRDNGLNATRAGEDSSGGTADV